MYIAVKLLKVSHIYVVYLNSIVEYLTIRIRGCTRTLHLPQTKPAWFKAILPAKTKKKDTVKLCQIQNLDKVWGYSENVSYAWKTPYKGYVTKLPNLWKIAQG